MNGTSVRVSREMLWRCRRVLPRSSLVRLFCTTALGNSDPLHHSPHKVKTAITPQLVQSTLSNCHSDLTALGFFLWCAKQPNYFHDRCAFQHMVSVLVRLTDRYKTVGSIVNGLETIGIAPKAQSFLLLLRIYWLGRLYELVFETFRQMEDFGFTPNTFAVNIKMDALFKIGRADLALEVLRQNQVPNFLAFNIALSNLCRKSDFANVGHVIKRMLKNGFYPNVETFSMVLHCYCKAGRLSEASQVLALMITLGFSLSVKVWSILIDGYCRLYRTDLAENLLEKMEQTGCSPNVVTYTALIKRYMESRMVNSAFGILRTMKSKGHAIDLVLCNVLIDCFRKNALYHVALCIFNSLCERRLVPDSYTFSALVLTLCYSRMFYIPPNVANILSSGADLVACNSLLTYCRKAGIPSLAVDLYRDMIGRSLAPDSYTFVELLSGLCGARRFDEAVNIYHGIVKIDPSVDAYVHTTIVDRLLKVGKYQQAIRLFKNAMRKKYNLDAASYTVAIRGLLMVGSGAEASALFNQMKEIGKIPTFHTYNVLLSGFCRERNSKMVMQILQEMVDEGLG